MSDPAIKIPCDVCEREFTDETYSSHRCVTPCNRALDAMRGAIDHGNPPPPLPQVVDSGR